ncbi:hypothetical protein [Nostoc sp.]|uniref:hypothetical protein n=1 Tax=Nostoc sp. TaxID=1180 RepID=UPI002FF7C5B0
MALPLDSYIGFGKTEFISNDKQWAALRLNKTVGTEPGKYDFTGTDFILQVSAMAGIIDGDNYWLVATLGSGSCNKGGVFEFKSWKSGENGAKGTFDKTKGEELCKQWQIDGCNAVIHCNDIPVLKVMVKVLSELNIIVTNESRELTVRLNITEDMCGDIETSLAEFWVWCLANNVDDLAEGMPQYDHALKLNEAGIMTLPAMTSEALPNIPLKNLTGKITGHKVECFPFKGELPAIDGVDVVLPKKEEKKGGKNNWGSGGSVDPKAALEARQAFVIKAYNDAELCTNATTLKDIFATGLTSKEGKEFLEFITKVMGR